MDIQKYSDFVINEARVSKEQVVGDLLDMLSKKPNVEMKKIANERGLYSLAGMKTYLGGKYTSNAIGNALGELQNDKKVDLKSIYVKVSVWDESIPYWYLGLTETQAKKLKEEYQSEEVEKNKKETDKKSDYKKVNKAATVAKASRKEAAGGVERKPGSPKKRVTRSKK